MAAIYTATNSETAESKEMKPSEVRHGVRPEKATSALRVPLDIITYDDDDDDVDETKRTSLVSASSSCDREPAKDDDFQYEDMDELSPRAQRVVRRDRYMRPSDSSLVLSLEEWQDRTRRDPSLRPYSIQVYECLRRCLFPTECDTLACPSTDGQPIRCRRDVARIIWDYVNSQGCNNILYHEFYARRLRLYQWSEVNDSWEWLKIGDAAEEVMLVGGVYICPARLNIDCFCVQSYDDNKDALLVRQWSIPINGCHVYLVTRNPPVIGIINRYDVHQPVMHYSLDTFSTVVIAPVTSLFQCASCASWSPRYTPIWIPCMRELVCYSRYEIRIWREDDKSITTIPCRALMRLAKRYVDRCDNDGVSIEIVEDVSYAYHPDHIWIMCITINLILIYLYDFRRDILYEKHTSHLRLPRNDSPGRFHCVDEDQSVFLRFMERHPATSRPVRIHLLRYNDAVGQWHIPAKDRDLVVKPHHRHGSGARSVNPEALATHHGMRSALHNLLSPVLHHSAAGMIHYITVPAARTTAKILVNRIIDMVASYVIGCETILTCRDGDTLRYSNMWTSHSDEGIVRRIPRQAHSVIGNAPPRMLQNSHARAAMVSCGWRATCILFDWKHNVWNRLTLDRPLLKEERFGPYANVAILPQPDPSLAQTWTRFPVLRGYQILIAGVLGTYVEAGETRYYYPYVRLYVPWKDTWTDRRALPSNCTAVTNIVHKNQLFLLGGMNPLSAGVRACYRYVAREDEWQRQADMCMELYRGAGLVVSTETMNIANLDGILCLSKEPLGLRDQAWTTSFASHEPVGMFYDPLRDTWSMLPWLIHPRTPEETGDVDEGERGGVSPSPSRFTHLPQSCEARPLPYLSMDSFMIVVDRYYLVYIRSVERVQGDYGPLSMGWRMQLKDELAPCYRSWERLSDSVLSPTCRIFGVAAIS